MSLINARMQQKKDTAANWTSNNPVLLNGELIVVETSTGAIRLKVGDGVKTFNQLPFLDETLRALITDVDNNNSAVVMTKNGESQLLDTFNIVKLSEEEYNQLIDSNTLDPDTLYFTVGAGDEKYSKVILKDLINNAQDEVLEILNIIRLSQEEYNSLAAAGTLDPKAIYMTEAANGGNTDELKIYIDNADTTTLNSAKTYSDNNFLKLSGGTVTGVTTFTNTTASTSTTTGAVKISGGLGVAGDIYANKVYGAVWNDFAEYRTYKYSKPNPGQVVVECGDDTVKLCDKRLSKGAMITSDTAGIVIGQKTNGIPVAVAGRVLAYTDKPRDNFKVGDTVCSGKDGTISKMHWWEKLLFPDRILGVVSCIPNYGVWGTGDIEVNNRIWIRI